MSTPDTAVEAEPTIAEEVAKARESAGAALDDVEKQVKHRDWTFSGEFEARDGSMQTWTRTYAQKPLSYTSMLQFTGLIGDKIAEAMGGGLTIDGVVGIVEVGRLSREDFASMDAFVRGLAKLAQYAPDVVEECQCIWLRVPLAERPLVKDIWSRPPDEGGLSLRDGEEMLTLFLEQNYEEVEDFFVRRLPALRETISALRKKTTMRNSRPASSDDDSPPSRRLSPIPDPTPSP